MLRNSASFYTPVSRCQWIILVTLIIVLVSAGVSKIANWPEWAAAMQQLPSWLFPSLVTKLLPWIEIGVAALAIITGASAPAIFALRTLGVFFCGAATLLWHLKINDRCLCFHGSLALPWLTALPAALFKAMFFLCCATIIEKGRLLYPHKKTDEKSPSQLL